MIEYFSTMESLVGELLLTGNGALLTGLYFRGLKSSTARQVDRRRDDEALAVPREQLAAYFAGELQEFDLTLALAGTAFQRRVWDALREIPFGQTASYGQVARRIGEPNAARAVGLANGRNPIAIVIPCHRVIGSGGALTGYGGGLDRKRWLLAHEGASAEQPTVQSVLGAKTVGPAYLQERR